MHKKECIAMLLAGGQGSRLGILTRKLAKPAVSFGGKYRIIDFTLSNCYNSGIDTVGVLTQYKPLALNNYIGIGSHWDLDRKYGGVFILPPYVREQGGEWYKGTADAIFQNTNFVEMFSPEYVLVVSGDHVYKMDYSLMLEYHKQQKAEATIAVIAVEWKEADRFGIMNTDQENRIVEFEEKPVNPKNNLASMGIYIFRWKTLRQYLLADSHDVRSTHDFGKNVIPKMLADGQKMVAYPFSGYWKDVGTVESFWEANMNLLTDQSGVDIYDPQWRIYSVNPTLPPHYLSPTACVTSSIVSDGCLIFGQVEHSVIFPDVFIGPGTKIKDSVIMAHVRIEENTIIDRAIIERKTIINAEVKIGSMEVKPDKKILVIGENMTIPRYSVITKNIEASPIL